MIAKDLLSLCFLHLCQVTLVALMVYGFVRLLAKNRPHLAHAMWALVLLKCVTPPIFSSHLSAFSWIQSEIGAVAVTVEQPTDTRKAWPEDASPSQSSEFWSYPGNSLPMPIINETARQPAERQSGTVAGPTQNAWPWFASEWPWVVVVVWLLGVVASLSSTLYQLTRFLKTVYGSPREWNAPIQEQVTQLARRLGVRRHVRVIVSKAMVGPAVFGLFRPTVVLPSKIVNAQTAEQLESMLAHELIHIRRGDLWWAWLQTIARALFWFHPLVRLAAWMMSIESERSCDEETVASLGCRAGDYARNLLAVLEHKSHLLVAPALPGIRPVDITSARLERVMKLGKGCHKRTPWWTWAVLLASGLVCLPGAALVNGQEKDSDVDQQRELRKAVPVLSDIPYLGRLFERPDSLPLQTRKEGDALDPLGEQRAIPMLSDIPVLGEVFQRQQRPVLSSVPPAERSNDLKREPFLPQEDASAVPGSPDKTHGELQRIQRQGGRLIVIEQNIVKGFENLSDTLESLGATKVSELTFHSAIGMLTNLEKAKTQDHVSKLNPAELPTETQKDAVYLDTLRKQTAKLSLATLTAKQAQQLLKRLAANSKTDVIQSPTITQVESTQARIKDLHYRPFVVPQRKWLEADDKAQQPQATLVAVGAETRAESRILKNNNIQLDLTFLFSGIVGSQTKSLTGNKQSIEFVVPIVDVGRIQAKVTAESGCSIVFQVPACGDQPSRMMVITPRVIKRSEIHSNAMNHKLETSPEQLPTQLAKPQPADYRLRDDIQYFPKSSGNKLVTQPAALQQATTSSQSELRAHFLELCQRQGVSVTEAEVDLEIEQRAKQFGLTAEKFIGLIQKHRGFSAQEARQLFADGVKLRKLRPQFGNSDFDPGVIIGFPKLNLPLVDTPDVEIVSRDPSLNWGESEARRLNVGKAVIWIRTKVGIQATKQHMVIDGKNLKVKVDGFHFASADDFRMEIAEAKTFRMVLTGNARVAYPFNTRMEADEIRHTINEFDGFELNGNTKFESPGVAWKANECRVQTKEGKPWLVLKGDAELRTDDDDRSRTYRGSRIEWWGDKQEKDVRVFDTTE